MIEAESFAAWSDLPGLIKSQKATGKDRALRLFACACIRRAWEQLPPGLARDAVELAERFCDGDASVAELDAAYREAEKTWDVGMPGTVTTGMAACMPHASEAALHAASHSPGIRIPRGTPSRRSLMAAERQVQVSLFRCLFRIPSGTTAFDPRRVTPEVVAVSLAALADRSLPSGELSVDRLAVLSDALEEAGCDDAGLLAHLRGAGPHFRGCWALDLVLGK